MTTVAVVEDDGHILAAVTRGLTERGHAVLGASTGLGALGEIVISTRMWSSSTSGSPTSEASSSCACSGP